MRALIFVVITLVVLCGGLFLIFIYSGVYNVSARVQNPGFIEWVLGTITDHSVEKRAPSVKAIPRQTDTTAQLIYGINSFKNDCMACHGAPGFSRSDIGKGLNPNPPDLYTNTDLSEKEIVWIAENGIKMTGMPSFGVTHKISDLWACAHFVKMMQKLKPGELSALTEWKEKLTP